jgi:predicted metal-dependent HD superfamily phosphohydrolase
VPDPKQLIPMFSALLSYSPKNRFQQARILNLGPGAGIASPIQNLILLLRLCSAVENTKGVHFRGLAVRVRREMSPPVVTKDPTAVEVEVQSVYLTLFPGGNRLFVAQAFGWVIDCFTGKYADYQAVDARYHDLEHTMQGTLCMARLLKGRHLAEAQPQLSQRMFELGLLAILLHDTGYLKQRSDREGTGAKYTITHVERSAEFAARLLTEKGFTPSEIQAVQNMIHCTGVDSVLHTIPFQNDLEKLTGFALGTADLLGQMAADDYVEKLPVLYTEFAEAVRYTKDRSHFIAAFSDATDLVRKTPMFWDKYVRRKLERDFGGLYRYLNDPYPDGPNAYLQRIERSMECIRQRLGSAKPQPA